jgi:RNA polymerase sigma factor (sigma-70 family)
MLETHIRGRGWPEGQVANPGRVLASLQRGHRTDEQLARAAGRGERGAFEALYERHHRPLLSFARHMLGRMHDAEDVVQHTFLSADRSFRRGNVPKAVRAWLYTVARNRCVSVLRARREDAGLAGAETAVTEGLAAEVEQREELRALLADLRRLPEDQRAALLLSELGELSHTEVARVIGVRPGKVKALVFQAREALAAAAHARTVPCRSIREELSVATGAALRKRHLRSHLGQCEGCRGFAAEVRRQRAALAAVLPVVPSVALHEAVVGGVSGGAAATIGAAGAGGALSASSVAAKLLTIAAVGGAAAGGGALGISELQAGRDRPAAVGAAPPASPAMRPDVADGVEARALEGLALRHRPDAAPRGDRDSAATAPGTGRRLRRAAHRRATAPGEAPRHHATTPSGRATDAPPGQATTPPGQAETPRGQVETPPGQAKKLPQRATTPPGQAKTPPGQAKTPPGQAVAPTAAPPAPSAKAAPAPSVDVPPAAVPAAPPAGRGAPATAGATPAAPDAALPPGLARGRPD